MSRANYGEVDATYQAAGGETGVRTLVYTGAPANSGSCSVLRVLQMDLGSYAPAEILKFILPAFLYIGRAACRAV